MKICMVAYAFYENDTRILQYTTALVERGDEVDVIALRRPGQSSEGVVGGVNVSRIQARDRNESGSMSFLFRMLRFLIRCSAVLAKRHFTRRYDLIHVHNVPDFLVFAAMVPKLAGVPVILDIHDLLPELYAAKFNLAPDSPKFRMLRGVERLSAAFSNYVIVANHLWSERVQKRSVPSGRCIAICNYPDPKIFFPRAKNAAGGKFIIMYPGTLNWFQGLDIAVNAFAKIAGDIPNAELHIYGEGPERQPLIELVRHLGLEGRVLIRDFVPVHEIAELMSQADLAVVPKRAASFANEAVSTKVAEFMSLGVPVLESRTRIGTYYNDDSRVRFFTSEDADDLANNIRQLVTDDKLRAQLTHNASEHMKQNNWQVRRQDYLEIVDFLADRSGPRKESPIRPFAADRNRS